LGCSFASAQSFWNSAGTFAYCNYFVTTTNNGGVGAGYDELTAVCGYRYNSAIVGFDATTANLGQPAFGKGVIVGDAIFDAEADAYTGFQWTAWVSDKVSNKNMVTSPARTAGSALLHRSVAPTSATTTAI